MQENNQTQEIKQQVLEMGFPEEIVNKAYDQSETKTVEEILEIIDKLQQQP